MTVQHDRNPVFVQLADGSIRNGYTVKLLNMVAEPRSIRLSIEGLPGAVMSLPELGDAPGTSFDVPVEPDRLRALRVFVAQPRDALTPGAVGFRLIAEDPAAGERDVYEAVFEAPES